MRTLVHISDLHFGRTDERLVAALELKIQEISPDVIAVSGDLTQRARPGQFLAAAKFLSRLRSPYVAVPGNHDIPLFNPIARLLFPFASYRAHIDEDLEPCFEDDCLSLAGLCTANPYQVDRGRIRGNSLEKLRKRFASAHGKIRVLVTHHPLDVLGTGTPGLVPASQILELAPDVLLAGHRHLSSARSTASLVGLNHRALLTVQSGTATSTRLRGETNAFNVLHFDRSRVRLCHVSWDGSRFSSAETSEFNLDERGWR